MSRCAEWTDKAREFAPNDLADFLASRVFPEISLWFGDDCGIAVTAPLDPADNTRHLYVTVRIAAELEEAMSNLEAFHAANRFEHEPCARGLLSIDVEPVYV